MLVGRWSLSLLHSTSTVLLDREGPETIRDAVRGRIEGEDDNRVVDLHVWAIGPNIYSVIISLVTHHPKPIDHYKRLIPPGLGIMHTVIEVHACNDDGLPIP